MKKTNLVRYVQFSFIRFFTSNQKAMLSGVRGLRLNRPTVFHLLAWIRCQDRWKGLLKESENQGDSSAEKHFYSDSLLWQGPQTYHLSSYQA